MSGSASKPYKFKNLNVWPQPHTHAIGQITLEWNAVEREFDGLLWLYFETDLPTARLITGTFGNRDKCVLLASLLSLKETSETIADAVRHAITLFDICRENRNHIAHSVAVPTDEPHKVSLRKPRKQNPLEDHEMELTLGQVQECANEIRLTTHYIRDLVRAISLTLTDRALSVGDGDQAFPPISVTLPEKPQKPRKLDSLLQIIPNSDQPPPQSSQA